MYYMDSNFKKFSVEKSIMAVVKFPTIDIFDKKAEKYLENKIVLSTIVQEKLDGCHVRIQICKNGNVKIGSRRMDLKNKQEFHGIGRIKEELIRLTLNLKKLVNLQASDSEVSLVVHGELTGRSHTGNLIMPRVDYYKEFKGIAFHAYEIQVNVPAYNGSLNDLFKYNRAGYVFGENGEYAFLNFQLAQKELKEAGFNVIPYELYGESTDQKIVIPPFKSLLFGHANEYEIEGYILRIRVIDNMGNIYWIWYKYKSKMFLEGGKRKNLVPAERGKDTETIIDENDWLDYLSKGDSGEILATNSEKLLLGFASDMNLERTKKNFSALRKFITEKVRGTDLKGNKLPIDSSETYAKFMSSKNPTPN